VIFGIAAIFFGILLIFIGTILQSTTKTDGTTGQVHTGGVIMIGPIPIIFGTDKGFTLIAIILAIVLMVVSYLLFYRAPPG